VSSLFLPQEATALTARTLLHGPAMRSCAFGTSDGALSPSHRLNAFARGASLVEAAAAMVATVMVEVVRTICEGPWPGRGEGVPRGATRRAGEARGCAVEGADGVATAELSRESSEDLRGGRKAQFVFEYMESWREKHRRNMSGVVGPARSQQVMTYYQRDDTHERPALETREIAGAGNA
jgi:hypothetical protein